MQIYLSLQSIVCFTILLYFEVRVNNIIFPNEIITNNLEDMGNLSEHTESQIIFKVTKSFYFDIKGKLCK